MRNFVILFLALALPCLLLGQNRYVRNKGNALLFRLGYAGHTPGGDLAERFGNNFSFDLGVDLLTSKSNWIGGLQFAYYFGSEVKEDVLANIRTPEGFIIGNTRSYADVQLRQRGFYAGAHIGKHISLGFDNPRSGIRITAGAGLLQHRIRLQDDPQSGVPQLSGEYRKGYDRLTNGLAFTEFIGYQLLSEDRRVNLMAGFEFTQGLTMGRRDFQFDTRSEYKEDRLDLLFGFRLAWILPIYFGKEADEVFY